MGAKRPSKIPLRWLSYYYLALYGELFSEPLLMSRLHQC